VNKVLSRICSLKWPGYG